MPTNPLPPASSLTLDEFLAVYPRMAGADGEEEKPAATEGENETTPEAPPAPTKPEDGLGDAGKRALDAERSARKAAEKAAREAQAKVQQYEDAQKTETEKLTGRAETAEERALAAERKVAALLAGLPESMAERLRGSTAEELKADAEALKAELKIEGAGEGDKPPAPGSLDGGARPPAPKKSLDDAIAEAEAKGDNQAVMRLNAMKLAQLATAT